MFIYSYAVRYDEKGNRFPTPLSEVPTVENGDVSKDGLTLKYKLRHNIKWQDGQPLTCKDLKFTWQVVMNPHNNVKTTDGFKRHQRHRLQRSVRRGHSHEARSTRRTCSSSGASTATRRFFPSICSRSTTTTRLAQHCALHLDADRQRPVQSDRVAAGHRRCAWKRIPISTWANRNSTKSSSSIMPDENTMETQLQTHEIDMIARGTAINWPRYQALAATRRTA